MVPTGTRFGVYEIVAPLGAGGMGEVYRARDTKLNRDVAIKLLPDALVHDAERVARFEREAQVLAALNHPHIAAIYGLEHSGPSQALVLELVEGETLAAHLAAHPAGLPLDEALSIARQVADALQAAHDKGIVHRDLKPANIALAHDGRAKVLDFGLAKLDPIAQGDGGAAAGVSNSPTLTFKATQAGIILGTAAYMSPEQAKGKATDKRSDVWAFGCVLFEMLAGRRAFEGEDLTETIAAVVRGEPDWTLLPASVPRAVRQLVQQCLIKDRQARIADIAVIRYVLSATPESSEAVALSAPPIKRTGSRPAVAAALVGGLIVGAAATAVISSRRPAEHEIPRTARFAVPPPPRYALPLTGTDRTIAISPDGGTVAYRVVTPATSSLMVRRLDSLETTPLSITEELRGPFFSPDGAWIGFFSGQELKKIAVGGGPVTTICRVVAIGSRGATWGDDNQILFATTDNAGIYAVPASGGTPRLIVPSKPDGVVQSPSQLPGGNGILFEIQRSSVIDGRIAVVNAATGQQTILVAEGASPQYANGWLVYAVGETLHAIRFDPNRLAVSGSPVSLPEHVRRSAVGASDYALSRDGTLVYIAPGKTAPALPRSLVWVDRRGHETPTNLPARAYADPRISPDGAWVAAGSRDEQSDIWIGNFARRTLTRMTSDAAVDQAPVWTPEGTRIVWSSQRAGGTPNLYIQAADGTGQPEAITLGRVPVFPTSITPDGRRLVFWANNTDTSQDILAIDLQKRGASVATADALVHTAASEMDADVSPDGRWLAYESNESGRMEIYVRPLPHVDQGRWQVSSEGGSRPLWARNGKELFFLDANGLLTAVSVGTRGAAFDTGQATTLFATHYLAGTTSLGLDLRGFDVAPDGQRFLFVKEARVQPATTAADAPFHVVLNWLAALQPEQQNR